MNLVEIRKVFLDLSGRFDLVDEDTIANTGADYFINAGQRWLDVHFSGKNARGRYFKTWPAGTYTIHIPACRVIEEVWAYDDDSKWELTKKDLNWLRREFNEDWRSLTRGKPKYHCPTVLRNYPATNELTIGDADFAANQANVLTSSPYAYDGILVMSPGETAISYEIWGLFHSNVLAQDTDTSWWSVRYPDVLVHAALRQVEIGHRNTQGVTDWTAAIVDMLRGLDQDQVAEEVQDINVMRG